MKDSQIIFFISASCIFGGAVLGLLLSRLLPAQHLRDNSRETVKVVTAMIATLAALVLGLLISSANSSFDAVDTAITQTGAKIILLDRALANYDPETKSAREQLRNTVVAGIEMFWPGKRPRDRAWRVSNGRTPWKSFKRRYASSHRRPTSNASCVPRRRNSAAICWEPAGC